MIAFSIWNLVISIPGESHINAHFDCVSIYKNTLHETSVWVLVDSGKISTSYNR